jgi:hypothetical protein
VSATAVIALIALVVSDRSGHAAIVSLVLQLRESERPDEEIRLLHAEAERRDEELRLLGQQVEGEQKERLGREQTRLTTTIRRRAVESRFKAVMIDAWVPTVARSAPDLAHSAV